MIQKTASIITAVILLISMLSLQAMAGGYRRNVAYAGSSTAHRFQFTPSPEFEKAFGPTRTTIGNPPPSAKTPKSLSTTPSAAPNTRSYYRTYYQTQPASKPAEFKTEGKLGTQWPKTLYNSKLGQGRELSRIFKP